MPVLPLEPALEADLRAAVASHGARWVECVLGDFTSVARGKRVHGDDFVAMAGCRLPSVVLGLTLTAGEPPGVFGPWLPLSYDDMGLRPDLATLAPRPGRPGEVTVLCEPAGLLRSAAGPVDASAYSPRAALRAVLAQLAGLGLQALVAPELELFLLQREPGTGALQPAQAHPQAPTRERSCEALSLERLTHFEPFFDELQAACEVLGIPFNGHAHESALSQFEVNFRHGEPLAMADAVFRFKRVAREIAARQGMLCSFAPKPFLDEPGTGTHWHLSLQRRHGGTWPHLFAEPDGVDSPALHHFIAGLQQHAPAAMALFAPSDMAFDRIALSNASPSHASWGHESRALAFRIPASSPQARRVENRLPGGDANPYLTLAATLGLGALGLAAAQAPVAGESEALRLPRSLPEALLALEASSALRELLGEPLVATLVAIKRHEHAERVALADPRTQWDLTHLVEWA
jgi:glutamine synthetase